MVRKIICILTVSIVLMLPLGSIAFATDYTAYDGNISSTYTTYFKDILANVPLDKNYVYFRSGQYDYDLVVGDIVLENNKFILNGEGQHYTISSNQSNYNSHYTYTVRNVDHFTLNPEDKIVYSDVGTFPSLEERSAKYEILQTIIICICCLCVVIRTIFYGSSRRR